MKLENEVKKIMRVQYVVLVVGVVVLALIFGAVESRPLEALIFAVGSVVVLSILAPLVYSRAVSRGRRFESL